MLDYYQQHRRSIRRTSCSSADHGHTVVPSLVEKVGFRVRPFVLDAPDQDYQVVLAYEGVMAYIYLADRSTCRAKGARCDWREPPRLDKDVMPLVRGLYKVNRTGVPVPGLKGTLDLIFARKPINSRHNANPFEIFDGKQLLPIYEYL